MRLFPVLAVLSAPVLSLAQYQQLTAPPNLKGANWKGVVAFYDDSQQTGEDWSWFSGDIKDGCEATDRFFAFAEASRNLSIEIGPEGSELTIEMTSYFAGSARGWLLVDGQGNQQVLDYDIANVDKAIEFCAS